MNSLNNKRSAKDVFFYIAIIPITCQWQLITIKMRAIMLTISSLFICSVYDLN